MIGALRMLLESTTSPPQPHRRRAARIEQDLLEYQPVMALRSGAVRGFASALRRGRGAGRSSPRVGRMLAHACVEARFWPGCRMSVAVSARELDADLLDQVEVALALSGLTADQLDIDLADAGEMEAAPPVVKLLQALRERGVGVVLGGVGLRGAGLPLLRHLPLSSVKLDRVLVRGLPLDACDATHTAVAAAHRVGLQVIADGVETLAQRDFLIRVGCDEAQGPLYSRPLPPGRLAALVHYGVDTCPPPRSGSETLYDRAVPH